MPQAEYLGLSIPDPALKLNEETGHWEYGEIDWEEFRQVTMGNGPCNRDRLAARRKLVKAARLEDLIDESDQLARIIGQSIATAKGIRKKKRPATATPR